MRKASSISIEYWFLLALLLAVVVIFFKIAEPFVLAIIVALGASIVFSPLQKRLAAQVKSEKIAALLLSLLIFAVIIVPIFILLFVIINQVGDFVAFLANPDALQSLDLTSSSFFTALPEILQNQMTALDPKEVTNFVSDWIGKNVGNVFSSTADLFLDLFIFFIGFYTFLTSRKTLHKEILKLSPLSDKIDDEIIKKVVQTVRSVVGGSLLVALIQGVVATIGFLIFSVPGAAIWGTITTVLAPIPIVGSALAMVPAAVFMLVTGHPIAAVGILIWLVFVGMIYNVLAPRLIEGKTKMNSFLILISLLGGLNLFGPVGFIIGPSVLAILMVLVELVKKGALQGK